MFSSRFCCYYGVRVYLLLREGKALQMVPEAKDVIIDILGIGVIERFFFFGGGW